MELNHPVVKDLNLNTSEKEVTEWLDFDKECPVSEFLCDEEMLSGFMAEMDGVSSVV